VRTRLFVFVLVAMATLAPAARAADATLLVSYNLDQTSGTTASDASGYGNEGTVVCGASGPTWTTGKRSGGLRVAGLTAAGSRYLSIPWRSALQTPHGLTVLAWVKFDQIPNAKMAVAGRYDGGNSDWWFLIGKNGNRLRFGVATGSGWLETTVSIGGSTLRTGVWYHLAATWDGSTERIYLNAVEQGHGAASGTMRMNGTIPIGIGAVSETGSPAWDFPLYAVIDGFKLYSRALTQAEVQADMNGSAVTRMRWQERF